MRFGLGVIALACAATLAAAGAPSTSLRPVARLDVFPVALPSFAPFVSKRPMVRAGGNHAGKPIIQPVSQTPVALTPVVQPHPPAVYVSYSTSAPFTSLRPVARPETPAMAAKPPARSAGNGKIGRICRDRDLQGYEVGRVTGRLKGCGIRNAVKLYSVNGIALSQPVTVECDTAHALKSWINRGMDPAVGRTGGGVVKLKVAAGYSCRTRNHKPGAKISEHGKGRAIDLSGFYLKNGDEISVLSDWGRGRYGRILREMHRSACGPFGTVLGPNADVQHRDHFHFDTARHRNGTYCR